MSEANILNVTVANYEETVVNCDKPVLLAIGASWCIDCRRIEPTFKAFAEKYADKLQFAHCNFDTEAALNDKFNVRHIPTLVVLKKGEIVDTLVEPKQVDLFTAFVEKAVVSIG